MQYVLTTVFFPYTPTSSLGHFSPPPDLLTHLNGTLQRQICVCASRRQGKDWEKTADFILPHR